VLTPPTFVVGSKPKYGKRKVKDLTTVPDKQGLGRKKSSNQADGSGSKLAETSGDRKKNPKPLKLYSDIVKSNRLLSKPWGG
jgi:hypothetical protein